MRKDFKVLGALLVVRQSCRRRSCVGGVGGKCVGGRSVVDAWKSRNDGGHSLLVCVPCFLLNCLLFGRLFGMVHVEAFNKKKTSCEAAPQDCTTFLLRGRNYSFIGTKNARRQQLQYRVNNVRSPTSSELDFCPPTIQLKKHTQNKESVRGVYSRSRWYVDTDRGTGGHRPRRELLRGIIVNRTYGAHKNLYIYICFPLFPNNIWSYLLWSPAIVHHL